MTAATEPSLARFNALPEAEARQALHACCAAAAWVDGVVAGRPYPDRSVLLDRSGAVLADLDWVGVRAGARRPPAHRRAGPPVPAGRRPGPRRNSPEWTRATADVRAALVEANRAYEERFGHVFLIFATGRTDTEMLAAARERLGNDDEAEREIVRAELGKIVGAAPDEAAGGAQ